MAKILFTWELGQGVGHCAPYVRLIAGLQEAGHEVSFAPRYLDKANAVFGPLRTRIYQAPYIPPQHVATITPVNSFARILHNNGYDSVAHLLSLVDAWGNLIDLIEPDLVVFDYSPTAMLAARDQQIARLAIGTGFHLPPRCQPMPGFHDKWRPELVDPQLLTFENTLLQTINTALAQRGISQLDCVAALFDATPTVLRTVPEMDHYGARPDGNYVGVFTAMGGAQPIWPETSGPRIFAYLKMFPTLPELLGHLRERDCPTLIYGDNLPAEITQKFASPSLNFLSAPLDLSAVADTAGLAIGNGTHGTTTELLLAGVPQLMLPLYGEQEIVANNVQRLGAGLSAPRRLPKPMVTKLQELLSNPSYRAAARSVAEVHRARAGESPSSAMRTFINNVLAAKI